MKIICAWCQQLIRYDCPECGLPLSEPDQPAIRGLFMTCKGSPSGTENPRHIPTEMHFSIERMTVSHGICEPCRVKLIAEHRARMLKPWNPSEEDAANLEQQLYAAEDKANLEQQMPDNYGLHHAEGQIGQDLGIDTEPEKKGVPQTPAQRAKTRAAKPDVT